MLGGSSNLPGSRSGPDQPPSGRMRCRFAPCLVLLQTGFAKPGRSPGLLVRSYRTVSPLPHRPCGRRGGLLSVALSRILRPVDVIHRLVLWSPDFPPARPEGPAGGQPARSAANGIVAGIELESELTEVGDRSLKPSLPLESRPLACFYFSRLKAVLQQRFFKPGNWRWGIHIASPANYRAA